jgi:transcriptional regulator with XRE-family HTH domain
MILLRNFSHPELRAFAGRVGISLTTAYKWKNGQTKPTKSKRPLVARELGVSEKALEAALA